MEAKQLKSQQVKGTDMRVRFENILYATDFSAASEAALRYGMSLARKYGSRIFVTHVVAASSADRTPGGPTAEERETVRSMGQLDSRLKGMPHEFILRKGEIWKEIAAIIEEKSIDLLVTGTRGRSGATKLIMGSVAEEIFRKAPCPVLTVGPNVCGEPDAFSDMRTILCPIDFHRESLAAIPYAISLAEQNRAHLYLVHVVSGAAVDELPEASLKAAMSALIPSDTRLWCEPKTFVEYGVPAEKIMESAEELGIDLLVLGVKPAVEMADRSLHKAMATAYRVIAESICPVLTVRGRTI